MNIEVGKKYLAASGAHKSVVIFYNDEVVLYQYDESGGFNCLPPAKFKDLYQEIPPPKFEVGKRYAMVGGMAGIVYYVVGFYPYKGNANNTRVCLHNQMTGDLTWDSLESVSGYRKLD